MNKLTDLQICKKIAEIEKLNQVEIRGEVFVSHGFSCDRKYNPLTDDALCFQLMVKYKIQLKKVTNGDGWAASFNRLNHSICALFNTRPNKAICLAIIEAHKDQS